MAKINPNIKSRKSATEETDIKALCQQLLEGDRYALSKAITLVESESESDERIAHEVLSILMKEKRSSRRIGISGAPGAGKSTLIDTLGMFLLNQGKKPAVLAIDPSSTKTGGSILGDKTRMHQLAQSKNAFIRPSPAGKTLGGVGRKTRESIILLEAAGYDPILVETVGVGQSETMVKSMTDLFILLIAPGAGDEIQGIKRGIMELADIILINKMDGKLEAQARETLEHYRQAVKLLPTENPLGIDLLGVSAIEATGFDKLWSSVLKYFDYLMNSGKLNSIRESQNMKWFEEHVRTALFDRILRSAEISKSFNDLKSRVANNKISPFAASQHFFELLNTTDEL